MLFRCDNCGTQFTVDACRVPNPKVRFRCVKCKSGYLVCQDAGENASQGSAETREDLSSASAKNASGGGFNRQQARQMLTTVKELPSLPFVATKVVQLTSSPKTTMKQMEDVILKDQALAAKVLRYSNSALYGRAGQISNLTDALVLLGFSTVKTIVIASSIKSMHASRARGYSAGGKTLWVHSIESAIAARLLAKRNKKVNVDDSFIVGLLHDIGKCVIESKLPGIVPEIVKLKTESEQTFEEVERKVLGIDHSEIGATVCRKWNFPEELEKAILYHHRPSTNSKSSTLSHLAMLSDAISHYLAAPSAGRDPEDPRILDTESAALFDLDAGSLAELVSEVEQAIEADKKQLDM